jgi:lipoprotein NlpI
MHRNRLQKLLEFYQNEPNDPFLKYALATEYLNSNEPDQALFYYEDLITII